jgi:hypothetical protein
VDLVDIKKLKKKLRMLLPGIFSRLKTHRPAVSFTDIAFVGAGTVGAGTTSCSVPYPATTAGQGLLLIVSNKTQYPIIETPTGWRRIKDTLGFEGSNGSDQGGVRQTMFWREATGSETGSVSVVVPGGNSALGIIYVFEKDPRANWDVAVFEGIHQTPNVTAFVAQSHEYPSTQTGDLFFISGAINTDAPGGTVLADKWTGQAISQTGATFTTIDQEINELGTTVGNDLGHISSLFKISGGAGSGPLIFNATAAAASATPANPQGVVHFVRLRQTANAFTFMPSGYREWNASRVVDTDWTGDASMIWDGMRVSTELTGTITAARYSVETHNGRPCYKFRTQLINSSNYSRRAEVSQPLPWQPAFPIGTQIIHEIRYETPADAPSVYREFDVFQIHTGTAPGGPWPLNSPILYLCFAHAGQAGWQNGTPAGGEMGLVLTTTNPDIRVLIPSVVWAPSSVYRIRYHIKFDYSTGDPCLKLWVNDSLVYENYTSPTIFSDSDIATHGAPANVGGVPKIGIYDHLISSGTAAANAIAAGHTGYVLYSPAQKMIVQLPSDVDYITDVTDNFNPIYGYVSTVELNDPDVIVPPTTLEFTALVPDGVDDTGAADGLVEQSDKTFTSITSGLRRTSIGALIEPARTYVGSPSNLEDAGWTKSGLAAGTNKTSIVPGVQAREYVSDGTTGILSGPVGVMGTFGTSKECLEAIVELTGTSTGFYMSVENSTGSTTECVASVTSIQSASPAMALSSTNASTDKSGTIVDRGIGPNGGRIYHICATYIPSAAGGSRRIRFRPNGASAQAIGTSIIIHYYNLSVGSIATSPFVGAGTRPADNISLDITNGEYDLRYTLQDNTVQYDYELTAVGQTLALPADLRIDNSIVRETGTNPPSVIGQVKKIEIGKFPVDFVEWDFDTCAPISTPPPASGTDILLNSVGKYLKTSQAYNGEGYTTVGSTDIQLDLVPRDGNLDADNFNHRLELIRSDVSAGTVGSRELLGFSIEIPSGGLPDRSIPIFVFQAHSGDNVAQAYDQPVFYIEISSAGRPAYLQANSAENEVCIGNRIVEFETFGTFNSELRHNTGVIATPSSRLDFAIDYTSATAGAGKIKVYIRKNMGDWNLVYNRTESTAWTNASDGGSEPNVHPFWKLGLYVPGCRTAAGLTAQEALNGGAAGSFTVQLKLKDKIKTARLLAADKYYADTEVIETIKPD